MLRGFAVLVLLLQGQQMEVVHIWAIFLPLTEKGLEDKLQSHRIAKVGRDLWRPFCPSLLPRVT